MAQHDFKYNVPVLPYGLQYDQAKSKAKPDTAGARMLKELIAQRLEAQQRTKTRRNSILDLVIKELRLN